MVSYENIDFECFDATDKQRSLIKNALDKALNDFENMEKDPSKRNCVKTFIRENFYKYCFDTGLDIEELQAIGHNIARGLEVDHIPLGYQSYFVELLLNNRSRIVSAMKDATIIAEEEIDAEQQKYNVTVHLKSNYVEGWMIDIDDYIKSNYQILPSETLEILLRSYYSLEYSLRYENELGGNLNWRMFIDIFGLANKYRCDSDRLIYYVKNIEDYSELESIENRFAKKYLVMLENNTWYHTEYLLLFDILSDSEIAGNMGDDKFFYFTHLVCSILKYNENKIFIEALRHEITTNARLYDNIEDCKFYKFMIKMINNGSRNSSFVRDKTMLSYILDDVCKIKIGKLYKGNKLEDRLKQSLMTMFCEIEDQRNDFDKDKSRYHQITDAIDPTIGELLTYLSKVYVKDSRLTQYEEKIINKFIGCFEEFTLKDGFNL